MNYLLEITWTTPKLMIIGLLSIVILAASLSYLTVPLSGKLKKKRRVQINVGDEVLIGESFKTYMNFYPNTGRFQFRDEKGRFKYYTYDELVELKFFDFFYLNY